MIDYQPIWDEVMSKFRLGLGSIHGYDHWTTVQGYGVKIARADDATMSVVKLFAILHDSCRLDDNTDPEHGPRAAEYAKEMRGRLFDIGDEHFDRLYYACKWHAHGMISKDTTIGACWDADRLDLGRVGIVPNVSLFSTWTGRRIAESLRSRSWNAGMEI